MMPLNHILKKCTSGYKLTNSQEKINHLMYMDNFKLFAKKEKESESLIKAVIKYSQDIGMEFGMEKCTMLIMRNGKQHITEGIELPNQEKIWMLGDKDAYKNLRILEAETIRQVEMKKKNLKSVFQGNEETTQNQTI